MAPFLQEPDAVRIGDWSQPFAEQRSYTAKPHPRVGSRFIVGITIVVLTIGVTALLRQSNPMAVTAAVGSETPQMR